jgi:hypothetical protein
MTTDNYQSQRAKKDPCIYPVPKDITPEQARKILDRLNSLTTEQQIANAVGRYAGRKVIDRDIPRNILKWKSEFGTFKDLQQLAATPKIGPARFAKILFSLCDY